MCNWVRLKNCNKNRLKKPKFQQNFATFDTFYPKGQVSRVELANLLKAQFCSCCRGTWMMTFKGFSKFLNKNIT